VGPGTGKKGKRGAKFQSLWKKKEGESLLKIISFFDFLIGGGEGGQPQVWNHLGKQVKMRRKLGQKKSAGLPQTSRVNLWEGCEGQQENISSKGEE